VQLSRGVERRKARQSIRINKAKEGRKLPAALTGGAFRVCRAAMKRIAALVCSLLFAATSFAEEAAKFQVSEFTFTRPEGWKQVEPKSTMRKAQLEVPGKDGGKSGEVVFFAFGGGQGGDVKSNVSRWYGQFSGGADVQKSEQQEWNGVKVTLVSTEGTMKASPISGVAEDQADFALLGAILDHADGPVFVKMTGPAALVKASREKFNALVKSATEKK
jgi:hypothetical protein